MKYYPKCFTPNNSNYPIKCKCGYRGECIELSTEAIKIKKILNDAVKARVMGYNEDTGEYYPTASDDKRRKFFSEYDGEA
jgi:hypothetical protein